MFKNWKAICSVVDKHFMWALALLDLTTDFGRMIVEKLPEFFDSKQQIGPIPLSAITQRAKGEAEMFSEEYIVSNGTAQKFEIPLIEFGVDEEGAKDNNLPLLPAEIKLHVIRCESNSKMGLNVEWQGKKLVMLEYNEHIGSVSFAPAELIAVDK